MTLLELLVKELPKRGGWPDGAHGVVQDKSGRIWFYKNGKPYFTGVVWGTDPVSHDFDWIDWDLWLERSDDHATSTITREQYEAAIASQQPEWNGEGLPPVGVTCEAKYNHYSSVWFIFECVGVSNGIAFGFADGAAVHVQGDEFTFRPICTKADRKREEAIQAMYEVVSQSGYDTPEPVAIYDAIAAGKIPGVELSK